MLSPNLVMLLAVSSDL